MPSKTVTSEFPSLVAVLGECLGHRAYRGYAPLSLLTSISQPDIFDQDKNPTGTQRNLSAQHARKAYNYVSDTEDAFYPEIILNIRDMSYVRFEERVREGDSAFGVLKLTKDPKKAGRVVISRMDGNHRLWYGDGHEKGMDPIERTVSFCILALPDLDQELKLFRDINDNQMGMNTSHLQNITARLLGSKELKVRDPALYIAQQLQSDKSSPFYKRVHEGGAVKRGATLSGLTTANLKDAVRDMLSRSAKLSQFPDTDVQYQLVKNYWSAVKRWLPDAWSRPTEYIIFKGVGLYAITYVGVEIIDRCLVRGKYEVNDMLRYLKKIDTPEVFSTGGAKTYVGRAGGRQMAADLIAEMEEEGEISLAKLQKMILGQSTT